MIEIVDFGLMDYNEVLEKQRGFFETLVNDKKRGRHGKEYLLIGEHHPVITLGRRAKESNVLYPKEMLEEKGVKIFHIERGGDVTYHNPGQLIVYPILDLDKHKLGVKDFVNLMEESIILLLAKYGIRGERIEGKTGVWIGKDTSNERKICAIGVKCSHFCTMHGLALNIENDLSGFQLINPCGFTDKSVTSLMIETKDEINMKEIKEDFLHIFLSLIFPFQEVLDLPE